MYIICTAVVQQDYSKMGIKAGCNQGSYWAFAPVLLYPALKLTLYFELYWTLHCTMPCTLHSTLNSTLQSTLHCTLHFKLHRLLHYIVQQCTSLQYYVLYCRPSKCPKFYTNRILNEKFYTKNMRKFEREQKEIFNQIYLNSTVFNIRLCKTAT